MTIAYRDVLMSVGISQTIFCKVSRLYQIFKLKMMPNLMLYTVNDSDTFCELKRKLMWTISQHHNICIGTVVITE